MEIVIFWLFLSIIAGVVASNKGRSGFGYFVLSLLLSPLIGIIAALAASKNAASIDSEMIRAGTHRQCPYCAEIVKAEALLCRHCGKDLPPAPQTEYTASG